MAPKTMPAMRKLRNSVTAPRALSSCHPRGGRSGDRPSARLRRRPYHRDIAGLLEEAVSAAIEPGARCGGPPLDLAALHLGQEEAPRRDGLGRVARGDEPAGIEEGDLVQG